MKKLLSLLLVLGVVHGYAQAPPDSTKVTTLYSTSWRLSYKQTPRRGLYFKWHKPDTTEHQRITIYSNEVHTSVDNGPYQVCAMRHRNGNELWLDCKQSDQVIYRVVSISFANDWLVMDMLVRIKDSAKYKLVARKFYNRKKD